MTTEAAMREQIALHGKSLFDRGFGVGSSGNISVLCDDGILITPTNSCMGRLDPAKISKVDGEGNHIGGDKPSKEAFLHLAFYRERPESRAVVHLHSTHSVAVSCLADIDPADVLPPITAYYLMRVGRLPLLPYFRPGDPALADVVAVAARASQAVLLANHGPVVAGKSLDGAVYSAEELEETAKLFLLLNGQRTRTLTADQIADLKAHFPD